MESTKLEIISESEDFYVLNKPSGLHSVRNENSQNPSLADLILKRFPELAQAAPKPGDGGLVQRLDFETSGVLLAAKTAAVWEAFRELSKSKKLIKTYLVLLEGECADRLRAFHYLGAPSRRSKKMRIYSAPPSAEARALPAESEFLLLQFDKKKDFSLAEVKTSTGRRHQIRAQAKALGHPLAGDALYGSRLCLSDLEGVPAFFLHALQLDFIWKGKPLSFQAPLPGYAEQFVPASLAQDRGFRFFP